MHIPPGTKAKELIECAVAIRRIRIFKPDQKFYYIRSRLRANTCLPQRAAYEDCANERYTKGERTFHHKASSGSAYRVNAPIATACAKWLLSIRAL
jgi:hypothetical protein